MGYGLWVMGYGFDPAFVKLHYFIIFVRHNGKCQIKNKERPKQDEKNHENDGKWTRERILQLIHDVDPTLKGYGHKYRQKALRNRVEPGHTPCRVARKRPTLSGVGGVSPTCHALLI